MQVYRFYVDTWRRSFESKKSGRDIIQKIDKIFGNNALIDVAAVSQAEGLTWPIDTMMQEFARLFDMRILGGGWH
jgi:hypothetical protein